MAHHTILTPSTPISTRLATLVAELGIRYLVSASQNDLFVTSTLAITNHLPVKIDFEVADGPPSGSSPNIIGAATAVGVGDASEVLACDMENSMPTIRLRIGGVSWSDWCVLSVEDEVKEKKENEESQKFLWLSLTLT